MSRRGLVVICILLAFATTGVGAYAWTLRARVDRAEVYIQSGVESVYFICAPVLRELQELHEHDALRTWRDRGMLRIARECLGQISDQDAQRAADEFKHADIPAIQARIQAKLDRREFPYKTASAVEDRFLPESYTK